MATVRSLLADTRHFLMTGKPDRLNVLQAGVGASATILQLQHELRGIDAGTRLCIDLEEYHVISKSGTSAGSTVTVIPGFEGSATSTHAAGTPVYISPSFSDWRIARWLNQACDDLSGRHLFWINNVEFNYVAGRAGYEIAAPDLIDIWRVKFDHPGPEQDWPFLPRYAWHFDQDANTDDFPSGKSLILRAGGFAGHKIRVSYKAKFSPLLDLVSFDPTTGYAIDASVTNLHSEAHTLLAMSAAIDLLGGRDVKRTLLDRQPEPRRQEEVPVGGASQAMRPLLLMMQDRLDSERLRLRKMYPEQIY